jgi:hypothetical protein
VQLQISQTKWVLGKAITPQFQLYLLKFVQEIAKKHLEGNCCVSSGKTRTKIDKNEWSHILLTVSQIASDQITFLMTGSHYLPLFPINFISSWVSSPAPETMCSYIYKIIQARNYTKIHFWVSITFPEAMGKLCFLCPFIYFVSPYHYKAWQVYTKNSGMMSASTQET